MTEFKREFLAEELKALFEGDFADQKKYSKFVSRHFSKSIKKVGIGLKEQFLANHSGVGSLKKNDFLKCFEFTIFKAKK